MQPLRPLAVCR